MLKKCNRFLAFLLAIALVIATFGSDFASNRVLAEDEVGDTLEVNENADETLTVNPTQDITPPAVRELVTGEAPAVLGERRGRTEDTADTFGRIVTIIVAAGIGFAMIFIKRNKNGEDR